jgi:hypothetical protein
MADYEFARPSVVPGDLNGSLGLVFDQQGPTFTILAFYSGTQFPADVQTALANAVAGRLRQ